PNIFSYARLLPYVVPLTNHELYVLQIFGDGLDHACGQILVVYRGDRAERDSGPRVRAAAGVGSRCRGFPPGSWRWSGAAPASLRLWLGPYPGVFLNPRQIPQSFVPSSPLNLQSG